MEEKQELPKDLIDQRIDYLLRQLGSKVNFWDEANIEEAWRLAASSYPEWDHYLENRSELPGGLIERSVMAGGKVIGWALIGRKNLDRPRGWKHGILGFNGTFTPLGNFPNKI